VQNNWFKTWFDTPYYHILYKNRSHTEAELFLGNLLHFLQPKPLSKALDLGCGKGRHAVFLNTNGLDVTGLDLSAQSISHANQFANTHLRFGVQDMRQPFGDARFDYVFNLFTSFGYFDDNADNQQVIRNVSQSLTPSGTLVLDYMNSTKALAQLTPHYIKTVDNIHFHINKTLENGFIVKNIDFDVSGKPFHFQERVKCISKVDFEEYFNANGLYIKHLFGDYTLHDFDELLSDRMIFIVAKLP
jgi:SAM-dependent methyltransferase